MLGVFRDTPTGRALKGQSWNFLNNKKNTVLDYSSKHTRNYWINKWRKEMNFLCRRIPSNVCRCSHPRGWSVTNRSLDLSCAVTSFQNVWHGRRRGESNFTVEEAGRHTRARRLRSTSAEMSHFESVYPWCGVMRMAFPSVVVSPKLITAV